jgi:hypothetical protein
MPLFCLNVARDDAQSRLVVAAQGASPLLRVSSHPQRLG